LPNSPNRPQPAGRGYVSISAGERPVIELSGRYSESKLMTALPQPGHEPPVAVTSGFLVPGGIEWLDFGDQVDRENLRTRPA